MDHPGSDLVLVEVRGLMHDPATRTPIVVLRDDRGDRFLPIWIGLFEAQAIALALDGVAAPRPMTHDLLATLLTRLDGVLERVLVSGLHEGTFLAQVEIAHGTETVLVDARPSDAIALALRLGAPIFVRESVFADATKNEPSHDGKPADEGERVRKVLESLSVDELGKYKM